MVDSTTPRPRDGRATKTSGRSAPARGDLPCGDEAAARRLADLAARERDRERPPGAAGPPQPAPHGRGAPRGGDEGAGPSLAAPAGRGRDRAPPPVAAGPPQPALHALAQRVAVESLGAGLLERPCERRDLLVRVLVGHPRGGLL